MLRRDLFEMVNGRQTDRRIHEEILGEKRVDLAPAVRIATQAGLTSEQIERIYPD